MQQLHDLHALVHAALLLLLLVLPSRCERRKKVVSENAQDERHDHLPEVVQLCYVRLTLHQSLVDPEKVLEAAQLHEITAPHASLLTLFFLLFLDFRVRHFLVGVRARTAAMLLGFALLHALALLLVVLCLLLLLLLPSATTGLVLHLLRVAIVVIIVCVGNEVVLL